MRYVWLLAVGIASFAAGWGVAWWRSSGNPSLVTNQTTRPAAVTPLSRIVAQGRIQPRGGVLNILVPPGQRVAEILVREGDHVVGGETELLRLESLVPLQLQTELAQAQQDEAKLALTQARIQAENGLRQAETALDEARFKLSEARSETAIRIAAEELELAQRQLADLESLSADPLTYKIVGRTQLDQRRLAARHAALRLEETRQRQAELLRAATEAEKKAAAAVEEAQRLLELARQREEEARAPALAVQLAERQLASGRVIAPQDAIVLRVLAQAGTTATTLPLVQLGNLEQMECVAEVSELFLARLRPGLPVRLSSAALDGTLRGTIRTVGCVVGSATLPDPNPLALVDRRTVEVIIDIAAEDLPQARARVNLQVNVEIELEPEQLAAPEAATATPDTPAGEQQ